MSRSFYVLVSLLLFFVLLLGPNYRAEILHFGTPEHDFGRLSLSRAELFRSLDTSQDIRLQTASYHGYPHTLLYLDFEEEIPSALHDKGGRFSIRKSLYLPSENAHNGKKAALFNGPKHGVEIDLGQGLWDEKGYAQDFTMELWFYPIFLYGRNTLIEKAAFSEQNTGSFRVGVEKDRIIVHLRNLFHDSQSQAHSLYLVSNTKIKLKKWQHLGLTYEASKGRLSLYLDGKEQDVRFARGRRGNWPMKFHHLDAHSSLLLGNTFFGLIDEFRIANQAFSPEQGELHTSRYEALKVDFARQIGQQKSAQIKSQVYSLPQKKRVHYGNISYQGIQPKGTSLNVYVRYAQHPFTVDNQELKWQSINDSHLALTSFRYFQWKAELRSNPIGDSTPILKSLKLDYTPIQLPASPEGLRVVTDLTKDLQICLEWKHSPLQDVKAKSGYYIYYGLRPGEYMGRLTHYHDPQGRTKRIGYEMRAAVDMPTTNQEGKALSLAQSTEQFLGDRIRVLITNELIEKNLSLDRRKRLPFLRSHTNYYFAVSTYDEFGESKLGNEVYIILRPQ